MSEGSTSDLPRPGLYKLATQFDVLGPPDIEVPPNTSGVSCLSAEQASDPQSMFLGEIPDFCREVQLSYADGQFTGQVACDGMTSVQAQGTYSQDHLEFVLDMQVGPTTLRQTSTYERTGTCSGSARTINPL